MMAKSANSKADNKNNWLSKGHLVADRYELARLLGSGGWGQVYLAQDQVLGRQVAVKRLLPRLVADSEAVSRFHREASVIAGIRDPQVLTIFDSFEDAGNHYMVMEYADAGTLSQSLMLDGTLDTFEALTVAIDICKGLRAVHNQGIVHRDVKPANILFFSRSDGFPTSKLGDFGIAIQSDDRRMTSHDTVLGTLIYLSPEQAARKEDIAVTSDIYSLGVIIYEMLAGELDEPFFLRRINEQSAREGIEHFAMFPEALQPTLYRALHDRPKKRFQSADEMLQALERTRGRLTASLATQQLLEQTIAEMRSASELSISSDPAPATPTDAAAAEKAASPPSPNSESATPAVASQPRAISWINTVVNVLVLLAVVAAGYFIYNTTQQPPPTTIVITQAPESAAVAAPVSTPTPTRTATSTDTPVPLPTPTDTPVSVLSRPSSGTAKKTLLPSPTATASPPPTATATRLSTATPTALAIETSSVLLDSVNLGVIFHDTGVLGNKITEFLPAQEDEPGNTVVEYQEGRIVWGEVVTAVGADTYRLDRLDMENQAAFLPDDFRLEVETSPALLTALDVSGYHDRGIHAQRGDFWLGKLRCGSATPGDVTPDHTLTIRLFENDELQAEKTTVIRIISSLTCRQPERTATPTPPTERRTATPTPPLSASTKPPYN